MSHSQPKIHCLSTGLSPGNSFYEKIRKAFEDFDKMVATDYAEVEQRFLDACLTETVVMDEAHFNKALSNIEAAPHQGKPKKFYHKLKDKHNKRRL